MSLKACYKISKPLVGELSTAPRYPIDKNTGTLLLNLQAFNFLKWIGTTYFLALIIMTVSLIMWWKLVFLVSFGLFALTYLVIGVVIIAYKCVSEHEDTLGYQYTWKDGWTTFKRFNTIMYGGVMLWFKNELNMM